MKLRPEDIQFDPTSYADPNGRVFHWDGGIYRAISHKMVPTYRDLLQHRRLSRLFEIGLIETEIAPLEMEGYGLVLKHRKIPFVSYGFEWCGAMLRDAASLVLDLNMELAPLGLELHDVHPWNVLFDGYRPIYIDFSSIAPIHSYSDWFPDSEFIKCFFNPLYLIAHGYGEESRRLMVDWMRWGVQDHDLRNILSTTQKMKWFLRNALRRVTSKRGRIAILKQWRSAIERIELRMPETEWSDYYEGYVPLESSANWTPKQSRIFDLLKSLHPKSLLDIGSNTGWYSKLAAEQGCQVVAFDLDETCVQRLYYDAFSRKHNILPLLINFCHPSLSYGKKNEFPGATDRLRCQMVLALSIVHHLIFKQKLGFEEIAENLAAFTEKWLLIEFVPKEDRYVSEWYNETFIWYNYDAFVTALKRYFRTLTSFPSNRPPRLLILCER